MHCESGLGCLQLVITSYSIHYTKLYENLAILPGAEEYASMGLVPEGAWRNKEGRLKCVPNAASASPVLLDLLFDPQTSGGLLAALPSERAEGALAELRGAGIDARLAGESGGAPGTVELVL